MAPKRITLVTSSLTCGGAEKNVALLANEWSKRGKTVSVISFDRHPPFFTLLPEVTLIKTDITRSYRNILLDIATTPARLLRLRREILATRPDVVVSFMDVNNLLTLMTTRSVSFPVLVAERSDPRIWPVQFGWRLLRRVLYPLATRILTQTVSAKSYFPTSLQNRIVVIPNPVLPFPVDLNLPAKLEEKRILSVGRLVGMKRFDVLIRAFASLKPQFPNWSLDIVGDGEERSRLETLVRELSQETAVRFHGTVSDTSSYLQHASLFALVSDFEGFPNALAEALAAGIPSISTETSGGRELVEHDKNGLLIPMQNQERLAAALRELMSSPERRTRMSQEALTRSKAFTLDRVLQKWEDVLTSL